MEAGSEDASYNSRRGLTAARSVEEIQQRLGCGTDSHNVVLLGAS